MNTAANTDMENHGVKVDISGLQEQFMKEILRTVKSKVKGDGRKFKCLMVKKF